MRAAFSPAAPPGAFFAVPSALFRLQPDFPLARTLAVRGIAPEYGVTASAARWRLSPCMLAAGCCFVRRRSAVRDRRRPEDRARKRLPAAGSHTAHRLGTR